MTCLRRQGQDSKMGRNPGSRNLPNVVDGSATTRILICCQMEVNFLWLFFPVAVHNECEWVGLAQRSRVVMDNFAFKYTVQSIEMCSKTRYKKNGVITLLQSLISYIFRP